MLSEDAKDTFNIHGSRAVESIKCGWVYLSAFWSLELVRVSTGTS
jgi:hypothetical protein